MPLLIVSLLLASLFAVQHAPLCQFAHSSSLFAKLPASFKTTFPRPSREPLRRQTYLGGALRPCKRLLDHLGLRPTLEHGNGGGQRALAHLGLNPRIGLGHGC